MSRLLRRVADWVLWRLDLHDATVREREWEPTHATCGICGETMTIDEHWIHSHDVRERMR